VDFILRILFQKEDNSKIEIIFQAFICLFSEIIHSSHESLIILELLDFLWLQVLHPSLNLYLHGYEILPFLSLPISDILHLQDSCFNVINPCFFTFTSHSYFVLVEYYFFSTLPKPFINLSFYCSTTLCFYCQLYNIFPSSISIGPWRYTFL
jgi:hypothetical protein